MTDKEQKAAAKGFAAEWAGKGDEKQDTHRFWIGFLQKVLDVENADERIMFEKPVKYKGRTTFIDAYIPETKVLIEQKSLGIDLDKKELRHGEMLTPFEQAEQYSQKMISSQKARYIIVSNFETFRIHDLDKEGYESIYYEINLSDLEKECHQFGFMIDENKEILPREMDISLKAGELVGKLYDAILKQYKKPSSPETLKSLNMLCVRLVFCLYAEDADIFGQHEMFGKYLQKFSVNEVREKLIKLFQVLDTKPEDRDPYMDDDLAAFPYVNGGLFEDENIEIPRFTDEIVDLLINKASAGFDWSEISPTIFGAVFESTLNPETRRSGGMHYTSIENIHKVIDPLFLDDLKAELEEIKALKQAKTRKNKLEAFQDKMSKLKFLDPACGSGNFLTETYISLRRLENEAISIINNDQIMLDVGGIIKVSIGQFYGIEINDFAVKVAETALWIAESQMMRETEEIVHKNLDFLPLNSYKNIRKENALQIDWESVVPKSELNYIMGNPPFVANTGRVSDKLSHSKKMIDDSQNNDRFLLFGKNGGVLDYVACWFKKSAEFMENTKIRSAFVATDSITQGQQVEPLWKALMDKGLIINFAHKSFKWKNDSNEKGATVYVVVIGFSYTQTKCLLFEKEQCKIVSHINAYLLEAPNIIVSKRSKPICDVPPMASGGKPVEGGYLIFNDKEKQDFLKVEPSSEKYFRRFTSGESFINGDMQWCLWLPDVSPIDISDMPHIQKRLALVRDFRLASTKEATRKVADTPHKFMEIKQPSEDYLVIPLTTSRNRIYIPMGYLSKDVIVNNGASFVPGANLYHFGVLTSSVHMAWMRTVCGYFGPSYRYSNNIVYNNFPWCSPTDKQKIKIEGTAKAILDAREKYFFEAKEKGKNFSLAKLYGDELYQYSDLLKAHKDNDNAVMEAYGFDKKMTDNEYVAELMKMYQNLTNVNH